MQHKAKIVLSFHYWKSEDKECTSIDYYCEYKHDNTKCPHFTPYKEGGDACIYTRLTDCRSISKFLIDANRLYLVSLERIIEKESSLPAEHHGEMNPSTLIALMTKWTECIKEQERFVECRNYCTLPADDYHEWSDCLVRPGQKIEMGETCPDYECSGIFEDDFCKNTRLALAGLKKVSEKIKEAIRVYELLSDEKFFNDSILWPDYVSDTEEEFEEVMRIRKKAGIE